MLVGLQEGINVDCLKLLYHMPGRWFVWVPRLKEWVWQQLIWRFWKKQKSIILSVQI
jgi:hypothetical protein